MREKATASARKSFLALGMTIALCLCHGDAQAFSFHGEIDFSERQASFMIIPSPNSPAANVVVHQRQQGQYDFSVQLKDVAFRDVPLTLLLEGRIGVAKTQNGTLAWQGDLASDFVLLDHKPIPDLTSQFEFRDGSFYLRDFSFNGLRCQGRWEMRSPYLLDLKASLTQWQGEVIEPLKFFPWLGAEGETFDGEISFSGTPGAVFLKGKILSFVPGEDGSTYQQGVYAFFGTYPKIQLKDSLFTREDGISVLLNGELDLSEQAFWQKQIDALVKSPIVHGRDNDLSWTLKHVESSKGRGATELKYLWRKNDANDPSIREDSGMLGVERKIEF